MDRNQEELGIHILENVRNELYYYFPYLDGAFACISGKGSEETRTIGTDGEFFLFSPEYLLELYVKKPEAVRRGYLHMLLHCLYLHLFRENQEDRRLWNLACDIAVESTLDALNTPAAKRPVGWVRQQCYAQLRAQCRFLAAGPIYRVLAKTDADTLNKWQREFYTDSHRLWPADPDSPEAQMQGRQWEDLGRQTELSMEENGRRAGQDTTAQALQAQLQAGRSRRTYKDFLRRFAVWHEEPHLDPDEFDLG